MSYADPYSSALTLPLSQSALAYPRATGLGFNRRTWRAGQTVGRAIKRWWENSGKRASAARTRAKARARSRSTPMSSLAAAVPSGGGDSKSSFTLVKPLKGGTLPKVASELPPSFVVNNASGRDESAVGYQSFVLVGDYFTVADVNLGFTLLNNAATAKILLRNVRGETLITNQENVNGRFTIYDIICKKETDSTVSNPLTAITTGSVDPASGGAGDYSVPGYTPFMNPRFTEYFRVLQSTEVILSPGACHSHVVNYSPNLYFSHELNTRVAGTGINGLTLYTLVQYHGTPINDVNTQTQVSLSHIAMDFVQKEQYKFMYSHAAASSVDVNHTLPSAFTTAGNVMQDDGNEMAENEA